MAFCKKCNREVGAEKVSRVGWIIGFLIIGLLVPLWPVTLPLFWGMALVAAVFPRTKKCGICKGRLDYHDFIIVGIAILGMIIAGLV